MLSMKTPLRHVSLLLALTLALASGRFLSAQENPPPSAPAAESEPAAPETPPEVDSDDAAEASAPGELRRLDVEEDAKATESVEAADEAEEPEDYSREERRGHSRD